MSPTGRKNTKNTRRSDAFLGFLIPGFFVALAAYQEINNGQIDKYVIGALLVFGLGALGWRVDILLEKFIEARAGTPIFPPEPEPQEEPAAEPTSPKGTGDAADQDDKQLEE